MKTHLHHIPPASGPEALWSTFLKVVQPNIGAVAEQPRTLIVVPESHLDRQQAAALGLARKIKDQNHSADVRVFLEGSDTTLAEKYSAEHALAVTGLRQSEVQKIYWPLAFGMSVTRFCLVAAANGNPNFPDAQNILLEALKDSLILQSVHGKPEAKMDILAIQEFLLTDIAHTSSHLRSYMTVAPSKLQKGILGMPDCFAGDVPMELRSLCKDALALVTPDVVSAMKQRFLEVGRYFGRDIHSFEASRVKQARELLSPLKGALPPVKSIHKILSECFASVRLGRELCMFRDIVKTPFDVGVLNIGLAHTWNEESLGLLKQSGIDLHILSKSG